MIVVGELGGLLNTTLQTDGDIQSTCQAVDMDLPSKSSIISGLNGKKQKKKKRESELFLLFEIENLGLPVVATS